MYLLPFHSFADVITNSSSELFVMMSETSQDAIKELVAKLTENEPEDVKIQVFSTFDEVKKFAVGHYGASLNILELAFGISIQFPFEFEEPENISFEELGWDKWSAEYSKAHNRNEKTLEDYIESRRSELEHQVKPVMSVYAWCCEDDDLGAVTRQLGAVQVGGYGNY